MLEPNNLKTVIKNKKFISSRMGLRAKPALADLSLQDYILKTASSSPLPGGGCASALCGALAAALSEMVANMTAMKGRAGQKICDMTALKKKAELLREGLLKDIDNDASAYKKVIKAHHFSQKTAEEQNIREIAIQEALIHASNIPICIAQKALCVLDITIAIAQNGIFAASTDAAVGALIAHSAVMGALYSAKANLSSIKDPVIHKKMEQTIEELYEKALKKGAEIPCPMKSKK